MKVLPRRAAVFVLIYAFMNSYYGVGSIKNAAGAMDMSVGKRALASVYGLSWLLYFLLGVMLLLRRKWALPALRLNAFVSAATIFAGTILYFKFSAMQPVSMLFVISRPAAEMMLFAAAFFVPAAPPPDNEDPSSVGSEKTVLYVSTGLGALLPWLVGLVLYIALGDELVVPLTLSARWVFIGLFTTVWFALPFVACSGLSPFADAPGSLRSPRVNPPLLGGFAGAGLISIYVLSLMWLDRFNSFLMAVSPPLVFTAMGIGIFIGAAFSVLFRR